MITKKRIIIYVPGIRDRLKDHLARALGYGPRHDVYVNAKRGYDTTPVAYDGKSEVSLAATPGSQDLVREACWALIRDYNIDPSQVVSVGDTRGIDLKGIRTELRMDLDTMNTPLRVWKVK